MNFSVGHQRSPSISHLPAAQGPSSSAPAEGAAPQSGHLPEGARASVGDGANARRAKEGSESNRNFLSSLWNGFKTLLSKLHGWLSASSSAQPAQPPISAPQPQPSVPPSRSGSLSGPEAAAPAPAPASARQSVVSPDAGQPFEARALPDARSQSVSEPDARLPQSALVPDAPPWVPQAPPMTPSAVPQAPPQAPPLAPSTVHPRTEAQEDLLAGIRAGADLKKSSAPAAREQSALEKAMNHIRAGVADENDEDEDVFDDLDHDNEASPASLPTVIAPAQSRRPPTPAAETATTPMAQPIAAPSEPVSAPMPKRPDNFLSEIQGGIPLRKTPSPPPAAAPEPAPSNAAKPDDEDWDTD